jgi:FkbM family methyltransferase
MITTFARRPLLQLLICNIFILVVLEVGRKLVPTLVETHNFLFFSEGEKVEACSSEEIKRNLEIFLRESTTCPSEAWYWEWQATLSVEEFVYIEVGCNKGTDALMNLRAFTGSKIADIKRWQEYTGMGDFACPFDNERWELLIENSKLRARRYKHLCIEAAAENAKPVEAATLLLGLDKLGLHVQHAAVSSTNVPSTVKFPVILPGQENIGIGTDNQDFKDFYDVQVFTVDGLITTHKIKQVDVLKIDTEGNDPRVLIGAVKTLSMMKPSYVTFENHGVGHWATFHLEDTIDFLNALDYECFWATNSGKLIKITSCWSHEYAAVKTWSNVACYHRQKDDLKVIMRKYLPDSLVH